jgi:heme/copper-type cytochrome/quinol oxidase subunit 3
VGLIQKLVIATIMSVTSGVIAMATPLASVAGAWAFFLVAVPMFAIVFAMYALQRTRGMQTSYHQPVRIVHLEHQSSGKVSALTLVFSHARYAQAFAHANKEIISRGVLEVQGG